MNKFGKLGMLVLVPLIAAIWALYPTYEASRLEGIKSEAYKKAREAKTPAESLAIMDKFKAEYGDALASAKDKSLKLGLDLRGGMYVTLEVDIVRLLEESALKETVDETFTSVIEKTKKDALSSDEQVLDLFLKNFNAIARPKGKSLISYFDVVDSKEITEEKIIEKLQADAAGAIEQAQEVIRQRIDKYGVAEPNIQVQGGNRIVLELPGVKDESEMRNLLSTTARLEFKLLRNSDEIVNVFQKIDKVLAAGNKKVNVVETPTEVIDTTKTETAKTETAVADTTNVASNDSTKAETNDTTKKNPKNPYEGLSDDEAKRRYKNDHKFTSLFITYYSAGENSRLQPVDYVIENLPKGTYIFQIPKDSIDKFNEILNRPEIKSMIPADLEIALAAKPMETEATSGKKFELYDLYVLKREAELVGDVITNAQKNVDPSTNAWIVQMSMNADGSEKWARITGANIGKRIAIVLDGRVYSAPNVINKISGGSSQITGMANVKEANLLEIVLKAGALKAPVKIVEERIVGASLGEDSITAGFNAGIVAALFVVLFMALYYAKGGMIADFAVLFNIFLIISILASLKGTLTLPGIAGIILTIGMAVDANILIFERIRDEISKGRTLRGAVDEGFKKAFSAIIDSNITTGITALILYYLGSGTIQGFALTLLIGICTTLFTAIMVSRGIIEFLISNGATEFNFGQPKRAE